MRLLFDEIILENSFKKHIDSPGKCKKKKQVKKEQVILKNRLSISVISIIRYRMRLDGLEKHNGVRVAT